jgi:hypothetical protein
MAKHVFAGGPSLERQPMEYQFQLKQEDQERLFEALKLVRLGDSVEMIKSKLGMPHQERNISKGGIRSHSLTFFVKRISLTGHNTKDHSIGLYFDSDKKLAKIGYSNIEPFFGEILTSGDWLREVSFTKPPAA